MQLFVDIPSQTIVWSPNVLQPVYSLSAVRGGSLQVDIQFAQGGVPTLLAAGTDVELVIKQVGNFDGVALAKAVNFPAPGTSAGFYSQLVDLSGVNISSLFVAGYGGVIPTEIECALEISWCAAPGAPFAYTFAVPFTLYDRYNTGDEPAQANSLPTVVAWLASVTGLTGGGSTNLDGLLTANAARPMGQVVEFISAAGVELHYQLRAGVAAANPPLVILPADYNALTNAVAWYQIQTITLTAPGVAIATAPTAAAQRAALGIYVVQGTLSAGVDTGSINISALGLTAPPTVATFTSLSKHSAGDANIWGAVIQSGVTAVNVPFELDAPTDNANRIPSIIVIP